VDGDESFNGRSFSITLIEIGIKQYWQYVWYD